MKVYVLYAYDYGTTRALHIGIDEEECAKEERLLRNNGNQQMMWIKEYDFANSKGFDLDFD